MGLVRWEGTSVKNYCSDGLEKPAAYSAVNRLGLAGNLVDSLAGFAVPERIGLKSNIRLRRNSFIVRLK
jgi:hypothetical protein